MMIALFSSYVNEFAKICHDTRLLNHVLDAGMKFPSWRDKLILKVKDEDCNAFGFVFGNGARHYIVVATK